MDDRRTSLHADFDTNVGVAKTRARSVEPTVAAKFAAKAKAWATHGSRIETHHRVFRGDAREMSQLGPDERVQLVVTSPPYWNLKKYEDDHAGAQLGHVDDRAEFLEGLRRVWQRCFNLLEPGGRLCVVVGDVCRSRREHKRHSVDPIHAYIQVECQAIGFDPLAPIIWQKISNLATEVAGNGAGFLGKPYEPNAIVKNDIEFILLFRKPGGYRHPTQRQRDLSTIDKTDHRRWFQQIWSDVPGEVQRHHPAPFPVEIARRLIGMFSFVGDTVLDPFWGTGNTTVAAIESHRSSVGFEIEPKYLRAVRSKFSEPSFGAAVDFYF